MSDIGAEHRGGRPCDAWQGFVSDSYARPAVIDHGALSDLTLYRITADNTDAVQSLYGADDVLALGRDTAEQVADGLIWRADVLTVTIRPLAHGSDDEIYAVQDAYFNGMDLGAPLLPMADAAGLDVDPENFDPYALLMALREGQS